MFYTRRHKPRADSLVFRVLSLLAVSQKITCLKRYTKETYFGVANSAPLHQKHRSKNLLLFFFFFFFHGVCFGSFVCLFLKDGGSRGQSFYVYSTQLDSTQMWMVFAWLLFQVMETAFKIKTLKFELRNWKLIIDFSCLAIKLFKVSEKKIHYLVCS